MGTLLQMIPKAIVSHAPIGRVHACCMPMFVRHCHIDTFTFLRCLWSPALLDDEEGRSICSRALRNLSTATPPRSLQGERAAACFWSAKQLLSRCSDNPQIRLDCVAALVNFIDASNVHDLQVSHNLREALVKELCDSPLFLSHQQLGEVVRSAVGTFMRYLRQSVNKFPTRFSKRRRAWWCSNCCVSQIDDAEHIRRFRHCFCKGIFLLV